ncbi:hypothetical protein LCGC14_1419380 [marine sediment metagenome]|uniref:Tyrosine specific protein phosphatases domain-containing protein n=1 Tax=marine sediment metagenome TaxID=412755 RepID=A0A0F9KD30_9ZZZZ
MFDYNYMSVCEHLPAEEVLKIDGVKYYGASKSGVSSFIGDFVINFTPSPNMPPMKFKELTAHFQISFEEELLVPWPDYGTPQIKYSFWKALHKFIKDKGWKRVCFHCQAGHGRTGTALASMMIANLGYTAEEALEAVRLRYCYEAVETRGQCDYLEKIDRCYNNRDLPDKSTLVPAMVIKMIEREEQNRRKGITEGTATSGDALLNGKSVNWNDWDDYEPTPLPPGFIEYDEDEEKDKMDVG